MRGDRSLVLGKEIVGESGAECVLELGRALSGPGMGQEVDTNL